MKATGLTPLAFAVVLAGLMLTLMESRDDEEISGCTDAPLPATTILQRNA